MVSISVYVITLCILPLSVFLMYLIRKWSQKNLNCPPGSSGLPFLGESLQFGMVGSSKFVSHRMRKYSPHVFQTSLFGEKMAVFCGVEGNKFIFTNKAKLLTAWLPLTLLKVLYSTESIGDNISRTIRFLHDFLKTDSLKQYIPIMDAMARQHIEKEWTPYQQVKAYHLIKKYIFALACRFFISLEDPTLVKKLAEHYDSISIGLVSVPIDLPGTAYNKTIKCGKMVHEELLKIIKARRNEQMESPEVTAGRRRDILSRMLLATDVNGQYFSDKDISNSIIGVVFGSYETTSSAIAFVLKHLAELPHIYNEVLREQMEIDSAKGADDLLTMEDIVKMKYSWNVLRESLRVTPASMGGFRETIRDCTYAGFTIPKGWKTYWNPHTTHKDPRYFPDPEKFDPTRFEGSGPVPCSYVPFGGGAHMCTGKEFARLQILIFMHNIVKTFKLENVIPNEKIATHISPVPEKGLPLRLHPNQTNYEPYSYIFSISLVTGVIS